MFLIWETQWTRALKKAAIIEQNPAIDKENSCKFICFSVPGNVHFLLPRQLTVKPALNHFKNNINEQTKGYGGSSNPN